MSGTVSDPQKSRRHRLLAVGVVVAIALLTWASYLWSRQTKADLDRDLRYIPKKLTITPEMELLRDYVRIDTSTPAGAAEGARWLASVLRDRGVEAELIESAPGRLNVYARVEGSEESNGLLLFNHIDVFPAEGEWETPPFEGLIAGDQLLGRGTLDMKSIAIAQLLAFVEVARSSRPPIRDLVFLATADEDTGSHFGMQWLTANRPDVFAGITYGITEGGITEMSGDQLVYFGIEIGGKQLVDVDLVAPSADTLREVRIALEPFMFPREPERILPEVAAYFRDVTPARIAYRHQLADIERTVTAGRFWDLPAPYRDLTQNSLMVKAPERDGTEWKMNVRLLNLPDEDPDARLEWLRGIAARGGARVGTVHVKEGPVPLSPIGTPLFQLLAEEAKQRYSMEAGTMILYRSTSDARFLRRRGIYCYGVAPFPVSFFQAKSIHGPNERVDLNAYQQGVAYVKEVTLKWTTGM